MSFSNKTIAVSGLASVLTAPNTYVGPETPVDKPKGFLWSDTSGAKPVLKQLNSTNPDVWVYAGMQDSGE